MFERPGELELNGPHNFLSLHAKYLYVYTNTRTHILVSAASALESNRLSEEAVSVSNILHTDTADTTAELRVYQVKTFGMCYSNRPSASNPNAMYVK